MRIKIKDFAGKEFSENKTATFSASVKQLETTLSVKETTVAEGGLFRIAFSIKNPNQNIGFRNIKSWIRSEIIPELTAEIADLMPGQIQVVIVNDSLAAPFVDEKKTYDIEALGTYVTTTGESYNFSKKASLSVTPVQDIISIVQKSDKKEVVQGENLTMTVDIKNNNEETIQVSAYDEYPSGLELVGGKTSETVFFDDSGSKQAYTYKLYVPLDYEQDEIKIITYATVGGKNYAGSKNLTVSVKPAEKSNETSQEQEAREENQGQEQQQGQNNQPEQQAEKEPGFFTKIINGISDFFKRLFKL
jgi:hypothetical protein